VSFAVFALAWIAGLGAGISLIVLLRCRGRPVHRGIAGLHGCPSDV